MNIFREYDIPGQSGYQVKTAIRPDRQNGRRIAEIKCININSDFSGMLQSFCRESEYLTAVLLAAGVHIFISMLNRREHETLLINAYNHNDIIFPSEQKITEQDSVKSVVGTVKELFDTCHRFPEMVKKEWEGINLTGISEIGIACRKHQTAGLYEYTEMVFYLSFHELICTYNPGKYSDEMSEAINQSILSILWQMLSNKDAPVGFLQYQETKELLQQYQCVHDMCHRQRDRSTMKILFEDAVKKNPDHALFICPVIGRSLSYQEVNSLSNKYANIILRKIKVKEVIGIRIKDPLLYALVIIASFKANCPYVPLNEDWPPEYCRYVIEDSRLQCVITDMIDLKVILENVLVIDLNGINVEKYDPNNLSQKPMEQDIFNIIYTSGSTGKPKGTYVSQGGIANFALWSQEEFGYSIDDVTMQCNSKSFDAYGANIFPQIISGSSVVLLSENQRRDLPKLPALIKEYSVTNFALVPSMLRGVLRSASSDYFKQVRFVILGGEHVTESLLKLCKDNMPHTKIINEYGTTEAAIASSGSNDHVDEHTIYRTGRLAANTEVYISDSKGRLVPLGLYGEIFIGGAGLGLGYTDQRETEKKILISLVDGHRLYATGDEGKLMPDGSLYVYGRLDNMAKVNGLRIEIKEIEYYINQIKGANHCELIVSTDGELSQIYAFIETASCLEEVEVKHQLLEKLPAYMIPDRILCVDQIPLTYHGKPDHEKLLELLKKKTDFIPQNKVQSDVLAAWKTALKTDYFDPHKSFFENGGNSLKAINLLFELSSYSISLVDTYKFVTILDMANYIEKQQGVYTEGSVSVIEAGKGPLGGSYLDSNIRPYDSDLFLDCMYSAVSEVAKSYGIPAYYVLGHYMLSLSREPFHIIFESLLPLDIIMGDLGIKLNYYSVTNNRYDILLFIKNCLFSGKKVIVAVDCFYFSFRRDTYMKQHFPHVILLSGYDDDEGSVYAVEHLNMDSKVFNLISISYKELLDAITSHHKLFFTETTPDIYIFTRERYVEILKKDLIKTWSESYQRFQVNRQEIINNLYKLGKKLEENNAQLDLLKTIVSNIEHYYRVLWKMLDYLYGTDDRRKSLFERMTMASSTLKNKTIKFIMKDTYLKRDDLLQLNRTIENLAGGMTEVDHYITQLINERNRIWPN